MKITMIGSLPPIKGVSPYTLGLVKALSKHITIDFIGFKSIYPEFLYPGGTKDPDAKEPVIPNVHMQTILSWYNPFSWIKAGFGIKTKIVHAQWWSWVLAPMYFMVLGITKLRGKHIILTIHNVKAHENGILQSFCNNTIMSFGDEYIVHSEDNKRSLQSVLKTSKKIHVVPLGLTEMPKSPLSDQELRKKYEFSHQDKILLFFGNIRAYKGIDVLLAAMKQLKNTRIKLIIAGQPWEDFSKYQLMIDNYKLKNRVSLLLQFISSEQVAELHKLASAVVYPYKYLDSASAAMSVSLYYQKPIVMTDVAALSDYIIDNKTVAKKGDSHDLASKIIYTLKHEGNIKDKFRLYSWGSIAKDVFKIYQSI